MSRTKTVTPVVAVPATQLKDDVTKVAIANGFTVQELERYLKQQEYRKNYSQRADVVQKRKEYRQKRYLRMKALREVLSQVE